MLGPFKSIKPTRLLRNAVDGSDPVFVSVQSTLAEWVKWPNPIFSTPQFNGKDRQYGSVCHQDPG